MSQVFEIPASRTVRTSELQKDALSFDLPAILQDLVVHSNFLWMSSVGFVLLLAK